jgi:HPt (histidine-containing phosphotransfer) domain-containing protein
VSSDDEPLFANGDDAPPAGDPTAPESDPAAAAAAHDPAEGTSALYEATVRSLTDALGEHAVGDMVRLFLNDAHGRIRAAQDSLSAGDLARVSREAHDLKATAGGFGLAAMRDAAQTLEQAARAGNAAEAGAAMAAVSAAMDRGEAALRERFPGLGAEQSG